MSDPLPSIHPFPDGRIVRDGSRLEIQISGDALARELQSATMNDIEAAFRAGFRAGFVVTREGYNGDCAYEHLAPQPTEVRLDAYPDDEDTRALEEAAVQAFLAAR